MKNRLERDPNHHVGCRDGGLDVRTLYFKGLSLLGSTGQPDHILPDVIGYIERGEIKPLIAETYALRDIHAAQTNFLAKKTIGKIVLTVA